MSAQLGRARLQSPLGARLRSAAAACGESRGKPAAGRPRTCCGRRPPGPAAGEPSPQPRALSPEPPAPSPQPRSAPHLRGAGSRRSCPRPAPCQLLGERRPATPRPGQVRAPRPRGAGEGGERPPAPPQAGTRRGLAAPSRPGPAGVALSVFTAFLVFSPPPHRGPRGSGAVVDPGLVRWPHAGGSLPWGSPPPHLSWELAWTPPELLSGVFISVSLKSSPD